MRIVIAEDGVLLREGLAHLLADEGHEVVASVGDALGLVEVVEREQPDVCIVDVRMPPTFTDEGLRAAIEIRSRWPDTPVLVLSQYVEERYAVELLSGQTSGVGYLLKQRVADVRDFLDALESIAEAGGPMNVTPASSTIARRLVVTEGAVEKHVTSIFTKLGLEPVETDHRRVLAVLRYLEDRDP